jgi:uncharacterized membrane protein
MLHADTSLSWAPAWPWSLPAVGLPGLGLAALGLALITVWTYLGVKNATVRRVTIILLLRLSALALVFGMMLRPSFAFTQLEGVESTKLLVVIDASQSMNAVEIDGQPSRWDQVTKLWSSPDVKRRLERLRNEQKIEVVQYLAAEELRSDEPGATATGKRTDIGGWLHELLLRHGHEKHLRGIVLVSDGADNGVKFSAQEKARAWRGIAPLHAFGVGDPDNPKFRKDIGLTRLTVNPELIFVKSTMTVRATAQAAGYKDAEVEVEVLLDDRAIAREKLTIKQEKDQRIDVKCEAPELPGEYKLTVKIKPQPGEFNKDNNEISTFVQLVKEKINVLWVDRRRVYEAQQAIRLALAPEARFEVRYFEPPTEGKKVDALEFYEFDQRHYDVIIIGDLSAAAFGLSNPDGIFARISDMVMTKKTGLLMLGGTETFAKGGWQKTRIHGLLPVKLPIDPAKAEFIDDLVRPLPEKNAWDHLILKLDPDPAKNKEIWEEKFDRLTGIAPLGSLAGGSELLLELKNGTVVMAATQKGTGRSIAFAADSTHESWVIPGSTDAYRRFWKQLVFYLAHQEDLSNQLWIKLDRRRVNANAGEVLNFTFGLRKAGKEIPGVDFTAKIIGPDKSDIPVRHLREQQHQSGSFQGAKAPGNHELVVTAKTSDGKEPIKPGSARFLVAFDDLEMTRPLAEHDTLIRVAANAEGRFAILDEASLLQYLDELKSQVNRESRHKTTHWPDWQRVPPSEEMRDQAAGIWNSFALVGLLLFVALLGLEWLLRRLWGLV